jgi:hypothetical protein
MKNCTYYECEFNFLCLFCCESIGNEVIRCAMCQGVYSRVELTLPGAFLQHRLDDVAQELNCPLEPRIGLWPLRKRMCTDCAIRTKD